MIARLGTPSLADIPALKGPPPSGAPAEVRAAPVPLHGGMPALLRFMACNRMLRPRYAVLLARLLRRRFLSSYGRRLSLDGLAFIGRGSVIQIGRSGRVLLGRWSWLGQGTKVRCHEGVIAIGAKTVLGQECTISAYNHVSIGRECLIADRVMMIDFDHTASDVERPVREQGIYKREVRIGDNVWIGYGAVILRGVTVGDNAIVGAASVVTHDVPANAVVAGVPARVLRMREEPGQLRWR